MKRLRVTIKDGQILLQTSRKAAFLPPAVFARIRGASAAELDELERCSDLGRGIPEPVAPDGANDDEQVYMRRALVGDRIRRVVDVLRALDVSVSLDGLAAELARMPEPFAAILRIRLNMEKRKHAGG